MGTSCDDGHDDLPILLTDHGPYAIMTLNRPQSLNCLTLMMMDLMTEAIESVRGNSRFLSLIMTGSGGVFSAGANLSEVSTLDPASAIDFSRRGQSLLNSLDSAAPLTIAAIDGYCLGGGLDIALSCDLRYATPRTSIQHPGTKRGLITGWGGTQRLARMIGADASRRLLVSGERIDAQEAYRLGLVDRVCEDALASARQLAERIAGRFSRDQLVAIKNELSVEN